MYPMFEIYQEIGNLMSLEERGHDYEVQDFTIRRDEDPVEALADITAALTAKCDGYHTRIIVISN